MIEKLHDQLILELKLNERSNTIFVLSSILLNLIILAVNSGLSTSDDTDKFIIMALFALLMLAYSAIAIVGIRRGSGIRSKIISGLMQMYRDREVDRYYDQSLADSYSQRYRLLIMAIAATGAVSLAVPFLSAVLM
jgi:acid phosphatase family membrane protein YuiD